MAKKKKQKQKETRTDGSPFDAIGDALYDVLHNIFVVPVRFIVSKSHHLPPGHIGIPVHLDYPIVHLLA